MYEFRALSSVQSSLHVQSARHHSFGVSCMNDERSDTPRKRSAHHQSASGTATLESRNGFKMKQPGKYRAR